MNLILLMAVMSLAAGLILYIWLVRMDTDYFYSTNVVAWLLLALFPVLVIFSFFPESSISGSIKGFSLTGAIGAFIFIWWYGTKASKQAVEFDMRIKTIRTDFSIKVDSLEQELELLKEVRKRNQQQGIPSVIRKHEIFYYTFKQEQRKKIALVTGDIRLVKEADVWVNSENMYMQMSRFYERSVSGIIRYHGAKKDFAGHVTEDVVANALAHVMGSNPSVQPATVLVTESGELKKTHNVKKLFHVASVQGEVGFGFQPIKDIGTCVTNSLMKLDSQELRSFELKSILFPILGAGAAKGDLRAIADSLINAAITYMQTTENSSIECIYFLTFTDFEFDTCKEILEHYEQLILSP